MLSSLGSAQPLPAALQGSWLQAALRSQGGSGSRALLSSALHSISAPLELRPPLLTTTGTWGNRQWQVWEVMSVLKIAWCFRAQNSQFSCSYLCQTISALADIFHFGCLPQTFKKKKIKIVFQPKWLSCP